MSGVPAADNLRPALVRYCRRREECMGTCGNACAWHHELLTHENVTAAAELLEAIDALADPFTDEPLSYEDAIGRLIAIYDLLHPEEGL